MSYASDRLYEEVIRKKLAILSSTVKVREILPHLSCLTLTDREDVEAKRETAGNYTAVQMLLDNLRRRENWPDEFIAALRKCEHRKLADEISAAYDRIRGMTNNAVAAAPPQAAASDSTAAGTVTTVTIHTVPATPPPLLTPPLVQVPAAPSSIAVEVPSLPAVPQVPETQRVEQVKVPAPAPFSEAASQAPAVIPSQAPPTVVLASKVTSPVLQNDVPTHSEANENKAPILDTPDGQITASNGNVISTVSDQASSSNTSQSQITNSESSWKSEKDQVPLAVKESTEMHPIQDTNPSLKMERCQEPEEYSDPTAIEIIQKTSTVRLPVTDQTTSIQTAQATPSAPTKVVTYDPSSINQEYFSKAGTLQVPGEAPFLSHEEPCSTVSNDLEISETTECSAEPRQSTSLAEHNSIESLSSTQESYNLNLCLEAASNLPQEDHYESFIGSQRGTLNNIIHFAEVPSAENLCGQPSSMLGNTANSGRESANLQHSTVISEAQSALNHENTANSVHLRKPPGHATRGTSDHEKSATINYQEQESNATKLVSNPKSEPGQEIGKFHLIAAAAAAAVAIGLLLAWKIKH